MFLKFECYCKQGIFQIVKYPAVTRRVPDTRHPMLKVYPDSARTRSCDTRTRPGPGNLLPGHPLIIGENYTELEFFYVVQKYIYILQRNILFQKLLIWQCTQNKPVSLFIKLYQIRQSILKRIRHSKKSSLVFHSGPENLKKSRLKKLVN